jgi:hypothetical protein
MTAQTPTFQQPIEASPVEKEFRSKLSVYCDEKGISKLPGGGWIIKARPDLDRNLFVKLYSMLTDEYGATYSSLTGTFTVTELIDPQLHSNKQASRDYSLAESKNGLGELVPILYCIVDGKEEIIDGFHRSGESPNWRREFIPWITNRVQLEAARLAVNFNRRGVDPEEVKERIALLAEHLKPDQIIRLTGIKKTTVYKYYPQEKKNQFMVHVRKKPTVAVSEPVRFVPQTEQIAKPTITTPEKPLQQEPPAIPVPRAEQAPIEEQLHETLPIPAVTEPLQIVNQVNPFEAAQAEYAKAEQTEESKRRSLIAATLRQPNLVPAVIVQDLAAQFSRVYFGGMKPEKLAALTTQLITLLYEDAKTSGQLEAFYRQIEGGI